VEQASRGIALASRSARAEREVALADRSDDELMLLARGGAHEAFDALVRRHQARTLRVAFRCLGETSLAADAAQNAFVALYRGLDQYRAGGKFTAYLYRILLNQCRMARRSAATESRALVALSNDGELNTNPARLHEQRPDVEVALRELSPKLRDVVLLRFGADLGHDEIAETLAIPVGTAKRRLFEAMAKLRKTLEQT
jgi:RNA polymerase sigma-70 factor (ECF subfamily)